MGKKPAPREAMSGSGGGKGTNQFEAYRKPDAELLVYVPGGITKKQETNAPATETGPKPKQGSSSKPKYVPLDAQMLREGLLPGRHPCKCLASRHKLLTNCLRCGRIICEQEGPGPCMTCGNEVFDKKQQSRIAQRLHEQLVAEGKDQISAGEVKKALEREEKQKKAVEYKNKLLDFDRSGAKRTKVIDDETDYYSSETNTWLSSREKDSLRQKEEAIRAARTEKERQHKITIDIAGRRVVESAFDEETDKESQLKKMYEEEIEGSRADLGSNEGTGYYANIGHHSLLNASPKFVSSTSKTSPTTTSTQKGSLVDRIQHDLDSGSIDLADSVVTLDDGQDQGLCLSMWQPWASLLVYGIKVVEGRSWSTTHRGRLWIAAAAKKASPEEMKAVIDQHVAQGPAGKKPPKVFPTSCVLGCVDIVDCLTQEQYQANVPDPLLRQSESPFVFVCANPRALQTPVPISGDHKIFSLEPAVWQKCKDGFALKISCN